VTWSPLVPAGAETPKTRWRAVPYTAGKGLDVGCGATKLFDTEFVFACDDGSDPGVVNANMRLSANDLSVFAAGSWDYVFSSFVLQYFPYKQVPDVLREWMRVVKVGGCVVLYLPDEDQYPKCNEPERGIVAEPSVNPRHAWNVNYKRLVAAMEKVHFNWDLVEYQVCDGDDEYALWFVFRRLE
jgi:SAM-dependent methyltransferase